MRQSCTLHDKSVVRDKNRGLIIQRCYASLYAQDAQAKTKMADEVMHLALAISSQL
jgi:hypothetical protein